MGPGCTPRVVVRAVAPAPPTPAPRARATVAIAVPTPTPTAIVGDALPTVDPVLWGPHVWRFLHIAAQHCIPSVRRLGIWQEMLGVLATGLPCPECREHYTAWLAANPLYVDDSTGLPGPIQAWILALHNQVSQRKGAPEWTPEQCAEAYRIADPIARNDALVDALTSALNAGVATTVFVTGQRLMMRGIE